MLESAVQAQIRLQLNATGRCRLVRNNVGVNVEAGVRYGLGNGSPDLVGVLRGGRSFCIEVKRSKGGRVSPAQVAWWRAYRAWGGLGGVANSLEEAFRLLDEAEAACSSRNPAQT